MNHPWLVMPRSRMHYPPAPPQPPRRPGELTPQMQAAVLAGTMALTWGLVYAAWVMMDEILRWHLR